MERDERAVRLADFVAFDYQRESAGLDEYVVLDVAGSAIVLQLAPDDELTIRAELAGAVDCEDHDDSSKTSRPRSPAANTSRSTAALNAPGSSRLTDGRTSTHSS